MKKIISLSLAALTLAVLTAPVYAARYEASIRGDVGATGSQVVFDSLNVDSNRSEWNWDFTARLAMYTSCRPCTTYVAASWQGSNFTHHDRGDLVFANRIDVKNEFSKAKLGMGLDLFKNHCLAFTMEVGANYLVARLDTDRDIPSIEGTPITSTSAKTRGAGLYSSFKGSYKLPSHCFLGNSFSVYGKAEIADIIGRQTFDYSFPNQTTVSSLSTRYNNIVEVDLEAAIVYSPCFKCWDNMNMSLAFGVRTDSFVNLFRHVDAVLPDPAVNSASLLSLARPTLFLELSMKM